MTKKEAFELARKHGAQKVLSHAFKELVHKTLQADSGRDFASEDAETILAAAWREIEGA